MAQSLLAAAVPLEVPGLTREQVKHHAPALAAVAGGPHWDRQARALLDRAARVSAEEEGVRTAASLRRLADSLLADGLAELAYAAALGQSERTTIAAPEAARRHDFGLRLPNNGRAAAWWLPTAGADRMRDWHVTGSLLGMDVRLAELSLLRLSSKPPPRRPSLPDTDRRAFVEAAALASPTRLTDEGQQAIAAALARGRARLEAARTPEAARALADEIRLGPVERSLLSWAVLRDPERSRRFLSPAELLWAGLEGRPVDAALHAWGAPGEPRLGCLCLQLPDRVSWETLAGRWDSGIFATAFPDLNIRLAELLAELQMPAALLSPVLASATFEFVNGVASAHRDDRHALIEFVDAIGPERLELYLALLTTDGPLVPVDGSAPPPAGGSRTPAGGRP
jgi:hypothetical protein